MKKKELKIELRYLELYNKKLQEELDKKNFLYEKLLEDYNELEDKFEDTLKQNDSIKRRNRLCMMGVIEEEENIEISDYEPINLLINELRKKYK